MELFCPHCRKAIVLNQGHPYHAGFSDVGFMYCDKCSSTLTFSFYDKKYSILLDGATTSPWDLNDNEKLLIESHVIKCSCDGSFKFDAPPRCPFCKEDISFLLKDKIHYLELGNFIDGEKVNIWKE